MNMKQVRKFNIADHIEVVADIASKGSFGIVREILPNNKYKINIVWKGCLYSFDVNEQDIDFVDEAMLKGAKKERYWLIIDYIIQDIVIYNLHERCGELEQIITDLTIENYKFTKEKEMKDEKLARNFERN